MRTLIINCSPVRDGATAEIVKTAAEKLAKACEVETLCIDDYAFSFCKGCHACHATGRCVQQDGVDAILAAFDRADRIVAVSPSYWADVPGQFKAFIDRCTPWSNTHQPHASLRPGKKGYAIALRTGPGMKECQRIIDTIAHFFGHLNIPCCGSLGLCGVEYREAVAGRRQEILDFCAGICAE